MAAANVDVWYFDSGATKHITSQRNFFTSLHSTPTRNSLSCANDSCYPVQGFGHIVLIAANDSTSTLSYVLYVLGIKKNLLSVFGLAKIGLVVKFVDDRCIAHDLSNGDNIIAFGSLCHGLYKLNTYGSSVKDVACAVVDS